MEFHIEEIIKKLLRPDNSAIKEGSEELAVFLKSNNAIAELCQVMTNGQSVEVKQYGAVLLKRKLKGSKTWKSLNPAMIDELKKTLTHSLIHEPEHLVLNAAAQLAAIILEKDNSNWPALFELLFQMLDSQHQNHREHAMFIVSKISGLATFKFRAHLERFFHCFLNCMNDPSSVTAYYTVVSLTNVIPLIGQDEMNAFQKFIPSCLMVIKIFIKQNEEKASKAMELLDSLTVYEVPILAPHLKEVLEFYLEVSCNTNLDDSLRSKSLSLLSVAVRSKKKYITKNKMINGIIKVLYSILCEQGNDQDSTLGFLGDEEAGNSPIHAAAQALDSCALHFPPDKLLPPLFSLIETAFKSDNVLHMKGAYFALAMIAEGCSDTLRTKHLDILIQCIGQGITSKNEIIRNSALFALGQFAEHLQPDISQYHVQLMPVLFDYLRQICAHAQSDSSEQPGVDKMFYALEVFCEHLKEEELQPHLPVLMECLFLLLSTPSSIHLKELAISTIAATASSAGEHMIPYIENIVELLKGYLVEEQPNEMLTLQVQSLDTLGQLCRCFKDAKYNQYLVDCSSLGMGILQKKDDPDVRKSCYLLFAALASVVKEELDPHLGKLVDYMMTSIKNIDGFDVSGEENGSKVAAGLDGLSDSSCESDFIDLDEEGLSDDEAAEAGGYSIENSFMSEKADTCIALREIALHCGDSFYPYLERCAEEIYKLLIHPFEDIRQAAVQTIVQFGVSFSKSSHQSANLCLRKWMSAIVPKLVVLAKTDTEYCVAMSSLEGLAQILNEAGSVALESPGHMEAIINCVKDVMNGKVICQDMVDEEDSNDDADAEQDELLVQYAEEIIPHLAKALGHDIFARHFPPILNMFTSKLKKCHTVSERSFTVGTLAEIVEALGPSTEQFVPTLIQVFLHATQDQDGEVRSNAIYGLGLLGELGGQAILEHYTLILATLSSALSKETFPRALDNICAAVCRLVMANTNLVPMEQVFPVLLRCLPVREDFVENEIIFKCFCHLWDLRHPVFMTNIEHIMKLASYVYKSIESNTETDKAIKYLLSSIREAHPDQVTALMQNGGPDVVTKLQKVFTE